MVVLGGKVWLLSGAAVLVLTTDALVGDFLSGDGLLGTALV